MKQKKLLSVVSRLVMAVALVACMAAYGLSQTVKKTDATLTNTEDSLKQARCAKLKELSKAKKDTITGWLILDGELIPGPYEVVVRESSVLVNGSVAVKVQPRYEDLSDEEKEAVRRELRNVLRKGCDSVLVSDGEIAARMWGLEFLNKHPVMAVAESSKSHCEVINEERIIREPPEGKKPPLKDELKKSMQRYGDQLQQSLDQGDLVIGVKGYGTVRTIPFPKSKHVIEELERITNTTPDFTERFMAMQEVIGYSFETCLIALRFKIE